MLHLESFMDEMEEFERVFYCSNQQVSVSKYDLLKLITLMKISNSLEVIAESLSVDLNKDGVTNILGDICSSLSAINSKSKS